MEINFLRNTNLSKQIIYVLVLQYIYRNNEYILDEFRTERETVIQREGDRRRERDREKNRDTEIEGQKMIQ